MAASFSTSSFATLATHASMQSISTTGCNITPWTSFSPHSPQWTHTSFARLIHRSTTLNTTSYVPFENGSNSPHFDTFIHGPFKFASVHGRKTQDRVSQADWDILKLHLDMFHNPLLCLDISSYSIHIDRGPHVQFHDAALTCQLVLVASHATDSLGTPTCQWQMVIASEQTTPFFFFLIHHDNGASSEVWHAEVDYLNIHFARESEKWERMEHYEKSLAFQPHFWSLPSLWLGAPCQVFLGHLRKWDSLLLGGTVWPSSDLRLMTTSADSCVIPRDSELFHSLWALACRCKLKHTFPSHRHL